MSDDAEGPKAQRPEIPGTGRVTEEKKVPLSTRLLTAAVLAAIVLSTIWLDASGYVLIGLTCITSAIAIDEFLRMSLPTTDEDRVPRVRIMVGLVHVAAVALVGIYGLTLMLPALIVGALAIAATVMSEPAKIDEGGRRVVAGWASLAYVTVLAATWPLLKVDTGPFGNGWLTMGLFVSFLSDAGGFFAGRSFGKNKLYPAVSPKKTWEGSVGGIIGGVGSAVGFGSLWLVPDLPIHHAVILGVLGSVFGQIGDLTESLLKRHFGVKDASDLLPGHGGMLDRLDGALFVLPMIYFYAKALGY